MTYNAQKIAPIGELRDKEILKNASTYIYSSPQGLNLLAHAFLPTDPTTELRPAILFFHGGFWESSMVTQFVPHCHHFASRGAVSISFEYRVHSIHQTGPLEALQDAEAALQWLSENADLYQIDPEKIILSGAGGGAFLALLLTLRKEKAYIPPLKPKALFLFSALVNTTPKGQCSQRFPDKKTSVKHSPNQLLRRKLPPMLFLHGRADRLAPFDEIISFRRKMRWRGNKCVLLDYAGSDHSFFNFNVSHKYYDMTIQAADAFLVSHGLLKEDVNSL